MVENATGTVAFFQAMASVLIANLLTVAFVYSFVKIHQKELTGAEEGRLTYLWLIIRTPIHALWPLYLGSLPAFLAVNSSVLRPGSDAGMGIASIVTPRGLTATGAANAQELKMIEHATTKAVTDTGASGVSADDIPTFANDDFDADSPAVFSVHQYAD